MLQSRALGQFFTPPEVVDLAFAVLAWLQPDVAEDRLLDLSCGEGAFLEGALQHGFHPEQLYGLDADPRLLALWAEADPSRRPRFALADGLVGGGEGLFDVVVGNPPFAGGVGPEVLPELTARYGWWRLTHARRPEGLPRELWFLERSLRLLRPDGLLAMVLPEGFLANRRWRAQRREMLTSCTLEAVIGLPRSVFRASRTIVKTCLLIARKRTPPVEHVVRLAELDPPDLSDPQALLHTWAEGQTIAAPAPWR